MSTTKKRGFCIIKSFFSFTEEKTLDIPLEDDPFLIKFLRPCKFYPQSAFELVSVERENAAGRWRDTVSSISLTPKRNWKDILHKHPLQIKRYYKFKLKHKNICDDLFPSSVRHVFEQQLIHFQPLRDQHGRRIMILEVGSEWKFVYFKAKGLMLILSFPSSF